MVDRLDAATVLAQQWADSIFTAAEHEDPEWDGMMAPFGEPFPGLARVQNQALTEAELARALVYRAWAGMALAVAALTILTGAESGIGLAARPCLRSEWMGCRASWDALVVRVWYIVAFFTPAVVAVACTSSATTARTSGYSVSLSRIVADANAQNQDNPSYRLAAPGTKVPMSEATAARAVITKCNEGRGTRVLVTGLVTGPVTNGSSMYWAVFVDPPGKHIAPSAEPGGKPVILNWIGAFVSVKTTAHPFCDFGRAADLPPLPVFNS